MNNVTVKASVNNFDYIGVSQILINVRVESLSPDWRKQVVERFKTELHKLEATLNESNVDTHS